MIKVGVVMGSQSDWPTMQEAALVLEALDVGFETRIVSAHRTPDRLFEYAETAVERKIEVIIAGAGGAAHLPGMLAAKTRVPVLGVPVKSLYTVGVGFTAFYRANAQRRAGWHFGDWPGRGGQCRVICGGDSG